MTSSWGSPSTLASRRCGGRAELEEDETGGLTYSTTFVFASCTIQRGPDPFEVELRETTSGRPSASTSPNASANGPPTSGPDHSRACCDAPSKTYTFGTENPGPWKTSSPTPSSSVSPHPMPEMRKSSGG